MVRLRRAAFAAAVVCAATMSVRVPAKQAQLADRIIPIGYAIPLSTPATSFKTIDTIRSVLSAAQVPFGIEGPARGAPPVVDLAQPRVEVVNLHGMSVAAALSAVARLDPSVHWSEVDGVIDVRLTSSPTWIDTEIPPFAVSNADPTQALDTIAGAIDPTRHGHIASRRPPGPDVVLIPPIPALPPTSVSVSQIRGTVLEGLNALVRGAQRSWRVTYDGPSIEAHDASIMFVTPVEGPTESPSPAAEAERADANLVRITIRTRVDFAITEFARLVHAPVTIETLPEPQPRLPWESENIPLVLDRREPRAGLDRLLAYDSRYTLSQAHGMFRVQPRSGSTIPALDQPVVNFSVANEPFQTALNRVLGRGVPRPVSTPATFAADRVFETPISVTANGSTVRDLLDTLCHAIDADWSVEPTGGFALLTVRAPGNSLGTLTSWRSTADATAVWRQPRATAVPVTLKSLQATLPQAMASVPMPFGAYLRDVSHTPGEQRAALAAEAQAPPFAATGEAAPQILVRLLENFRDLEWRLDGAVYHIQPVDPIDPDEIINRKVAAFDFRVPDLGQAARYMIDVIVGPRARDGIVSTARRPTFTGGTFSGPVQPPPPPPNTGPIHLVFGGGTLRDALDAVTRTHNTPSWILLVTDTGQGHSVNLTLCSTGGSDCQASIAFDR